MNNEIFAIFDTKAEAYMPPFFERNAMTAIRALEAAMNDPEHPLRKNAEDYTLYHIATWNPETGEITVGQMKSVVDCWILRSKIVGTNNLNNMIEDQNNG